MESVLHSPRTYLALLAASLPVTLLSPSSVSAQDCSGEETSGYTCVVERDALEEVSLNLGISDNNPRSAAIDLPFPVDFFSQETGTICIHRDGVVEMGCGETFSSFPSPGATNVIYVFGAALELGLGSVTYGVLGEAPSRRFVVSWNAVRLQGQETDLVKAQLVIEEGSSEFLIRHWQVPTSAAAVRVGAVGAALDQAITLFDGEGQLLSGRSYRLLSEFSGGLPPVVSLTTPTSGDEGATVSLVASATDADLDAVSYAWDLDDDGVFDDAVEPEVMLTLGNDGQQSVAVEVTDGTYRVSRRATVAVNDLPPTVQLTVEEGPFSEGGSVRFSAVGVDPGGDAVSYVWTVGGNVVSSEPAIEPTFPADGSYTVGVVVRDAGGLEASESVTVEVENRPPEIQEIGADGLFIQEGDEVAFVTTASDPGMDELSYTWSFGDGSEASSEQNPGHTFRDEGEYTVELLVSDADGGESRRALTITVSNAPPRITSAPPVEAVQLETWTYELQVADPGLDDSQQVSLLNAPQGMTVEGLTLSWTPDGDQAARGSAFVMVQVVDGDGGQDIQSFDVLVDLADSDNDGMTDNCETLYGFDNNDPEDADEDFDLDGVSNLDECLSETNPTEFNGPTAPALAVPVPGAVLDTAMPSLFVAVAHDPDGDELNYTFEVYADEALVELVASSSGNRASGNSASWSIEVELEENSTYWWRARASDENVAGAWSQVGHFFVDVSNQAPTAPIATSPQGTLEQTTPTFAFEAAEDPESERVIYIVEVFDDEALNNYVMIGQTSRTSWTPTRELAENTPYWWRVVAEDERGLSVASEALPFTINVTNDIPTVPVILSPDEGDVSDSSTVTLSWEASMDEDGDMISYGIQVSTTRNFEELVFETTETPEPADSYSLVVEGLDEDQRYHVRVNASDGRGASLYARSSFVINAENGIPARPTLLAPVEGRVESPGRVSLYVNPTRDPDGDALTYRVQVYEDEALTSQIAELDELVEEDGRYVATFDAPETSGTYHWTATAIDEDGAISEASAPRSFGIAQLENQAPEAPLAVTPALGLRVESEGDVELVLKNSVDPDGDALSYTFVVYKDATLNQVVWERSEVAEGAGGVTAVTVDLVDQGDAFYWLAYATDAQGLEGPSSQVASFKLEAVQVPVPASASDGEGCSTMGGAQPLNTSPLYLGAMALGGLLLFRRQRR